MSEKLIANKKKVLIIDSEFVILMWLRSFLGSEFNVETAGEYGAACKKIQAHKYDMIVTEFNLRGLGDRNGTDFVQEIRQSALNGDTPVICMTGCKLEKAEKENFVAVIGKPDTEDLLFATIKNCIG